MLANRGADLARVDVFIGIRTLIVTSRSICWGNWTLCPWCASIHASFLQFALQFANTLTGYLNGSTQTKNKLKVYEKYNLDKEYPTGGCLATCGFCSMGRKPACILEKGT